MDGADAIPGIEGITKPGVIGRARSKTWADEKDGDESEDLELGQGEPTPSFRADTRRVMALPEQDGKMSNELAKRKSALDVNRTLYRAHRQMRLSVMARMDDSTESPVLNGISLSEIKNISHSMRSSSKF
jgi:hypothetical protein